MMINFCLNCLLDKPLQFVTGMKDGNQYQYPINIIDMKEDDIYRFIKDFNVRKSDILISMLDGQQQIDEYKVEIIGNRLFNPLFKVNNKIFNGYEIIFPDLHEVLPKVSQELYQQLSLFQQDKDFNVSIDNPILQAIYLDQNQIKINEDIIEQLHLHQKLDYWQLLIILQYISDTTEYEQKYKHYDVMKYVLEYILEQEEQLANCLYIFQYNVKIYIHIFLSYLQNPDIPEAYIEIIAQIIDKIYSQNHEILITQIENIQFLNINILCTLITYEKLNTLIISKINRATVWNGDYLFECVYQKLQPENLNAIQASLFNLNIKGLKFIQNHSIFKLNECILNDTLLNNQQENNILQYQQIIYIGFILKYLSIEQIEKIDDQSLDVFKNLSLQKLQDIQDQYSLIDVVFLFIPKLFINYIVQNQENIQLLFKVINQLKYLYIYKIRQSDIQQLSNDQIYLIYKLLSHKNPYFNFLFIERSSNEQRTHEHINKYQFLKQYTNQFIEEQCLNQKPISIYFPKNQKQAFTLIAQLYIDISQDSINLFEIDKDIIFTCFPKSKQFALQLFSKTINISFSDLNNEFLNQELSFISGQFEKLDVQFCIEKTQSGTSMSLWVSGDPVFFYQTTEKTNIKQFKLERKKYLIGKAAFAQACLPFCVCKALHCQQQSENGIFFYNMNYNFKSQMQNSIISNIIPLQVAQQIFSRQNAVYLSQATKFKLQQGKIVSNSSLIQVISEINRQNIENLKFNIQKVNFQTQVKQTDSKHKFKYLTQKEDIYATNLVDTSFIASSQSIYDCNVPINVTIQYLNDIKAIYNFNLYEKNVNFQYIKQQCQNCLEMVSLENIINQYEICTRNIPNITFEFNQNSHQCQKQSIIKQIIFILDTIDSTNQMFHIQFLVINIFPLIQIEWRLIIVICLLKRSRLNANSIKYLITYCIETSFYSINVLFSLQQISIIQQIISFLYSDLINCISSSDGKISLYQKLDYYYSCSLIWKFMTCTDEVLEDVIKNEQAVDILTMLFIFTCQKQNFLQELLKYKLSHLQQELIYTIIINIISRCSHTYSKLLNIDKSQMLILLYQNYYSDMTQLMQDSYIQIISNQTIQLMKNYFQSVNANKINTNCLVLYSVYQLLNDQINAEQRFLIDDIYQYYIKENMLNNSTIIQHSQQLIKQFSLNNQNTMIFSLYKQLKDYGVKYNNILQILERGILSNINQLLTYKVDIGLFYIQNIQIQQCKVIQYEDTYKELIKSPLYQLLDIYGYFDQQNIIKIINDYLSTLLSNYQQEYSQEKLIQITYYFHCIFCSQTQAYVSVLKQLLDQISQYGHKFIEICLNVLITYNLILKYNIQVPKLLKKVKSSAQRILALKLYLTDQCKDEELQKLVNQILLKYKNKNKFMQSIHKICTSVTTKTIQLDNTEIVESLLYFVQNQNDQHFSNNQMFIDVLNFLLNGFIHTKQVYKNQYHRQSQIIQLIQQNRQLLNELVISSYRFSGFRNIVMKSDIKSYPISLQESVYLNRLLQNPFQQILQVFQFQNKLLILLQQQIMIISNVELQRDQICMTHYSKIMFLLQQPFILQQHPIMKDSYSYAGFQNQRWNQLLINIKDNFDIINDISIITVQEIVELYLREQKLIIKTSGKQITLEQFNLSCIQQFKQNYISLLKEQRISRQNIDVTPIYSFISQPYILNVIKLYCYSQNPLKFQRYLEEVKDWFINLKKIEDLQKESSDQELQVEIQCTLHELFRGDDEKMIFKRILIQSGIDINKKLLITAYELSDRIALTSQAMYALELVQ